eukprot:evm.model.scf_313EXC.2 EVM.evm.TU.scf_313EXC.2   scf_313EXC:18904-23629(-)
MIQSLLRLGPGGCTLLGAGPSGAAFLAPLDAAILSRCSRGIGTAEPHQWGGGGQARCHTIGPQARGCRWAQGPLLPPQWEQRDQLTHMSRSGRPAQGGGGSGSGKKTARASSMGSTEGSAESITCKNNKHLTLPTILTLCRLVAIPLLVATFFWDSALSSAGCSILFVVAAVTDWLDGYLARKLNAVTPFGKFLDPVADKLMVAAALVLLSSRPITTGFFDGNGWLIPTLALVIVSREITMSSLREWAATVSSEAYKAVAVGGWGKWKTASQMAALVLLLYTSGSTAPQLGVLSDLGVLFLGIASTLTVWSLALYFKNFRKYL